jgi:hypothetical protein
MGTCEPGWPFLWALFDKPGYDDVPGHRLPDHLLGGLQPRVYLGFAFSCTSRRSGLASCNSCMFYLHVLPKAGHLSPCSFKVNLLSV